MAESTQTEADRIAFLSGQALNNVSYGIGSGFPTKFLTNLTSWAFCPPSDHLWTIHIKLHNNGYNTDNGNTSLANLMANISAVNTEWKNRDFWAVSSQSGDNEVMGSYIKFFQEEPGIFLAQDVNISRNSANIGENIHTVIGPQSGFITYGKIVNDKVQALRCNINFLVSNYDITDIIFDRWIAAILQQGLIEDNDQCKNIKADIWINQYACRSASETRF